MGHLGDVGDVFDECSLIDAFGERDLDGGASDEEAVGERGRGIGGDVDGSDCWQEFVGELESSDLGVVDGEERLNELLLLVISEEHFDFISSSR